MILEYSDCLTYGDLTELTSEEGAQSKAQTEESIILRFVDGSYIIEREIGASLYCVERLKDRTSDTPKGERGLNNPNRWKKKTFNGKFSSFIYALAETRAEPHPD